VAAGRPDALAHQRRIDEHFTAQSLRWRDLYQEPSLAGLIHQQRHAIALQWIDDLGLPAASRILEVGCGAGLMTVDLARRGYHVDAIDSSQAMVELARQTIARTDLGGRVAVTSGDAHHLPFRDGSCQLVLALGVLPFLHSPAVALLEMRRVLVPNGYVLLSSDNLFRLNHLLDPRYSPALARIRQQVLTLSRRLGRRDRLVPNRFSFPVLMRLFLAADLKPIRQTILGFGPFSLLGWRPLPDSIGIRLHQRLQTLADRGVPVLRSTGAQHLALVQRQARASDAEVA
jgi:ubiquinone/menaquinone biosynthesis C-methylase UbiE